MPQLHVLFVIGTGLAVAYADEQGLAWMLGKKRILNPTQVRILHWVVTVGLLGLIVTGGLMFIDRTSYLLHQTTFLVKMGFVLALLINGFFIDEISAIAASKSFADTPHAERIMLGISGLVSITGWVGAGLCGLLLAN